MTDQGPVFDVRLWGGGENEGVRFWDVGRLCTGGGRMPTSFQPVSNNMVFLASGFSGLAVRALRGSSSTGEVKVNVLQVER